MNIQKILLSSFLIVLGFSATAQTKSKASFGIRGGFDYSTIYGKDQQGQNLTYDMVPRYNVGFVFEFPLANQFFIQSGLLYSTKGAKAEGEYLSLPMNVEFDLGYLELPVNFVYKPTMGKGNLLLGFGPYLGYGIAGNVEYNINGEIKTDKIDYTDEYTSDNPYDSKYFNHLDYGGNLLFGYQFGSGISAQLNAQLGLAQIKSENTMTPNSKVEFKNSSFGISLGYMFK